MSEENIIDNEFLINDILNKNYDAFILEFPELKNSLEKLKENKKCEVCKNDFMKKLFDIRDHMIRLYTIYGKGSIIKLTNGYNNIGYKLIRKIDHFYISSNDWEKWFENFLLDENQHVKFMNSFYNPSKDEITVSVVRMVKSEN